MCKLGLVFLISLLTGNTYAQNYFVLLQSDNRQPFYVRLGGLRYSSSSEGHLILAQLKDSTYTVAIGFPSQLGAEQTYSIGTAQKDQEFLIKDHGDTGWGLFDPQSREWITAIARSGGREVVRAIGVRRDDAFSRLMAGVVQDTAVLYNDYSGADLAMSRPAATPATTSSPSAATHPVSATTGTNPSATAASVADTALASQPVASKADSPTFSVAPASARPDSQGAAGSVDSFRSIAANPGASGSTILPPSAGQNVATGQTIAAGQTVAVNHPDTVTMTPKPLNRPNSGSAQHKSAPMVDSPSAGPANQPAPGVVKVSEKRLTRNMRLVYADKGNGIKADTVVVMIPLDTSRATAAKPRPARPDSTLTARSHVATTDSIVAARPRATGSDSGRTAKSRTTTLDSIRIAKSHLIARDSTRITRPRMAGADSARIVKSRTTPDSPRLAKSRATTSDTSRLAQSHPIHPDTARNAKLRPNTDSGKATAGGTREPNPDSPNQNSTVKVIVPTPVNPPVDKARTNDSAKKPAAKPALPYINSDCHNFATEYDVDKLRVRMLEATKDEDRVAAALKVFKTKCFSTRQILALSEVLTADAGKYRFFETAYPFAADEHFRDLVTQLTDPVYINKFKTLTGNH